MTTAEVEALVRNMIVHFGLPFTVLSVVGSPIVWNVRILPAERQGSSHLTSLAFGLPPFGRRSSRSCKRNSR